jgi:hypothetical protein
MAYTLTQLRLDGREQARNAKDSTEYSNRNLDKALQRAAARWCRGTRELRTTAALQLVTGSNVLPAFPADFRPEQAFGPYLTLAGVIIDPNVSLVGVADVLQSQLIQWPWLSPGYCLATNPQTSPPTGQPTLFCCSSTSAGVCNYLCDRAYILNIPYWQKLTAFTAGAMGAWSSATAYQPGDVVSSTGTLYQALARSKNLRR